MVQSPRRATKVTLNWDFVKRHREVRGAVMLDVFAGPTLLKTCKALGLGDDWGAPASGGLSIAEPAASAIVALPGGLGLH